MKQHLRKMNKRGLLFAVCFMAMLCASAQKTFKYQAKLDSVKSTGFYKIKLSPAFLSKSDAGFTDIRIIDNKGNFVPYITSDNLPRIDSEVFVTFPELKQKPDTGISYTLENVTEQPINKLWLKLRNTAVKRTVNLYGSDDHEQWFAVDEDIPLQSSTQDNGGSYMQYLAFPASNYKYFKVLINDKHKAPLSFLMAGVYAKRSVVNSYSDIPILKLDKADSGKTTHIIISLADNYLVNTIMLDIDNPKFYKRNVTVYAWKKMGREQVTATDVMSGKNGTIFMDAKTNKLELEIDNGDNPPLHVAGIKLSQADNPIAAYLQAGKSYKLLTGDASAATPVYDLKFFTDSIHAQLPEISGGKVEQNELLTKPGIKANAHDYTVIIWMVIIGALLLLTLLTVKMTKEVNKRNSGV
ncbi:MAG: hypothetical protein ACTHMI_19600 [Mucilaginibacter sp.]